MGGIGSGGHNKKKDRKYTDDSNLKFIHSKMTDREIDDFLKKNNIDEPERLECFYNFGGMGKLFKCQKCDSNYKKLYLAGDNNNKLLCRKCANINYPIQRKSKSKIAEEKALNPKRERKRTCITEEQRADYRQAAENSISLSREDIFQSMMQKLGYDEWHTALYMRDKMLLDWAVNYFNEKHSASLDNPHGMMSSITGDNLTEEDEHFFDMPTDDEEMEERLICDIEAGLEEDVCFPVPQSLTPEEEYLADLSDGVYNNYPFNTLNCGIEDD